MNVFGEGNSYNVEAENYTEMIADRISSEEPDTDTVEILRNDINNTNNECSDVLLIGNNNASTNSTREYEAILDESSSTTIEQQSYHKQKSPVFTNTQFSQKRTRDFELCDVTNEGEEGYSNSYDYDIKVEGEGIKTFNCIGEKCLQTDTESASGNKSTRSDFDYLHEIVQNNSDAFTVNEQTCKNEEDTDVEFTKSKDEDPGIISVDQESEVNMAIDDVEIENVASVEDNELENEDNSDIENIASDEDDDFVISSTYSDEDDDSDSSFKGIESVDLDVLEKLSQYREHNTSNVDNIVRDNSDNSGCLSEVNVSGSVVVDKHKNSCVTDKPCTIEEGNERTDPSDTEMESKETTGAYKRIRDFPTNFAELPEKVLQHIYGYLPLLDLISVQFVCNSWNATANHSTVWKCWPFKLKKRDSIETMSYRLSFTQYLHTVVGRHADTELIFQTLLKNVRDLRKLNINFSTPVSPEYMKKLVDKFKSLESVTINVHNADILELLEVLKVCSRMKRLRFSQCYVPENTEIQSTEICQKLVDNFPLLQVLDFAHFELTDSDILYALQSKAKQLVHLSLKCPENTTLDVFKLLVSCKFLKELKLAVCSYPSKMLLDMWQMTCLKICELNLPCDTPQNMLKHLTFPQGLVKLTFILQELKYRTGLLERIIKSCPDLKHLSLTRFNDLDFTEQLTGITSLKKLILLKLTDCKYLRKEGLACVEKFEKNCTLKLVITTSEAFYGLLI